MKRKYEVELSQNGWEYTGILYIACNSIQKINNHTLIVDGVQIEYDEDIGDIEDKGPVTK